MALARGLATVDLMCFGIGMRSRFLDELLLKALAAGGVSTVVCLGAGLDARPWRLDLPPDLRWIEVDFPEMLDYKAAILASETPRCRLERMSADLNDPAQRAAILSAVADDTALMITEGLLMYLPAGTVEALAADSARTARIRYWLLDVTSLQLAQRLHQGSFQDIDNVRAADHLQGAEILDVVARNGWSPFDRLTYVVDGREIVAHRIKASGRDVPAAPPDPVPPDDPSGVHLFSR
jgi:methyltransferase (TIGR00027 family)